jgi:lipopolysaccharide export system permease protein
MFFGFGLGVLVSGIYWIMLFVGHTLGIRSGFSPFISMWFPNFIILGAGLGLFVYRIAR